MIIAFAIFIFVTILSKAGEKLRKKEEAACVVETPKISDEVLLLKEIRDLLKK